VPQAILTCKVLLVFLLHVVPQVLRIHAVLEGGRLGVEARVLQVVQIHLLGDGLRMLRGAAVVVVPVVVAVVVALRKR